MTRNDKRITTLYLDRKLVEKAKAEGINLSEFVNNALKELLEDSETLELAKIEEEIRQLRQLLLMRELKRQELLKRQAERQEERNREANLRKVLLEYKEAKGKYIRAETEEELAKYGREETKLFNEALKVAGIQRGTEEFLSFSRIAKQGKIEEAVALAKRFWKTS